MKKRYSPATGRKSNRKKLRSRIFRFEALEPRCVLDGSVVINEIMYHPDPASQNEADYEWVELYNQMSIDMDISGWRLEGAIQYTFAEGAKILGHGVSGQGYLVIASNPTAVAGIGGTNIASGSFTGRLDNSGEEIRLVNRDGRLISVVDYGDGEPWPVGPDGSGFSLAKLDRYTDSSDPASWRASRQIDGTPGTENFPIGADPGPSLVFNEIPAASSSGFWVEIANQGTSSINLNGYQIKPSAGAGTTYTFSAQSLGAGQILLVDQSTLGFGAASGDKLYFYSPSKDRLLDARVVTNAPRGLEASHGSEWLYPVAATPGAANTFQLNTDIVINEIMYHAIPNYPVIGVTNTAKVVGIDATTQWRFKQSASGLTANWAAASHPVDGTTWFQGPAVLGFEVGNIIPTVFSTYPIRTTLTPPGNVVTTYFETDFTFSGNLSDVVELTLGHVIDDGAVFYLNGVEVLRYNMPTTGAIDPSTRPLNGLESAYIGPVAIPKSALVVGTNRLSVEVHQVEGTTDVAMGAELFMTTTVIPAVSFSESPEEWIELYNKGSNAVDLSGWKFSDAITFTIPNGTIIPAGGYLVVAKDSAALEEKYSSITIIGDFSGSLSNSGENIVLTDVVGNPVDNVRYYDSANWHETADGGGSSLELRSPNMDNTKAESWAPSIESGKSDWNTYTYTMTAATDTGPANVWNEFLFGFIQSGEMLIDDVTVTRNPGTGSASQLIQNGTFQGDTLGTSPQKWRIIGNHGGTVVVDPTNANNKVLRLVATGRTDHEGNNAGTTLAGNTAVVNGSPYQISFRAKWITGSPQINSRLYLNRVGDTIAIEVPHDNGTPGAQNSTYVANAGPTYSDLKHGPVVPVANQPVTVSVRADDPNGIASMKLFYSLDGVSFANMDMALGADGRYAATITGQAGGSYVQFYVQGEDIPGAISMFPAAGPNSRAMYAVIAVPNPNAPAPPPIEAIRIVARPMEAEDMLDVTNIMSNQNIGATIIYNNSEVFYNVGLRLKGSSASRGDPTWAGSYAVEFNPDQLFRGVYEEIALDSTGRGAGASGGQQQVQILVNQILNHAGYGLPSNYDDLVQVVSPNAVHSGIDTLQLARYSNDYLDESYANGSDGNLYEYEIVYYSNKTIDNGDVFDDGNTINDAEDLKDQRVAGHLGAEPMNYGDDPDKYRWNYLLKNNREGQDFSQIIAMNQAFSLTGIPFVNAISSIIDVDQWLRTFAAATVMGVSDTFATAGNYHNIAFYVRPSDNKVLMLPWDWDESFRLSATSTIHPGGSTKPLRKILTTYTNDHAYFSHLYDLVTHEFTTDYMTTWVNYFHVVGQQDSTFLNQINYITNRRTSVINQIKTFVPDTTQFNIITNNGNPFSVETPTVTLNGTGYVDFHTIRVRGSSVPLDVTWNNYTTWQTEVPLGPGENDVILDAYDVRGNLVHSDSITVTTSANAATPLDSLRITEMNYHPANPPAGSAITDSEEYEFIELTNIGATSIDLQNCAFTMGITFTFPSMTLNPGEHIVLVKNPAAFAARYGTSIPIAGTYSNNLSNSGEQLVLVDSAGHTIHDFTFLDDDWMPAADGPGYSMVVVDSHAATSSWGTQAGWRRSANIHGSPGVADPAYLIGDYNGNGEVDAADYVLWRKTLGSAVTIYTGADGSGNGTIDQNDNGVWRANFGQTIPQASGSDAIVVAAIAEPGAPIEGSIAVVSANPYVDQPESTLPDQVADSVLFVPMSPPRPSYRPTGRAPQISVSALTIERPDNELLAWRTSQSDLQNPTDGLRVDNSRESDGASDLDDSPVDTVDEFFALLGSGQSAGL